MKKLMLALCALVLGVVVQSQVCAADFVAVEKLPENVQATIYKSAIEMNKDIEMSMSQMGLANSSLQDAIVQKLDKYADKGGPIPVYKFPVESIDEVSNLLEQHEKAAERMAVIGLRLEETKALLSTLNHKLTELEKKK